MVICDISPKIKEAADALRKKHPGAMLYETITDVSDKASVQALTNFAKENLGTRSRCSPISNLVVPQPFPRVVQLR